MLISFRFRAPAIIVALALTLLSTTVEAGQVNTDLNYQPPTITKVDSYDLITIPDGANIGEPGSPSLPVAGVWLLLPPGEQAVSVRLTSQKWQRIPGSYLPVPISEPKRLSDPTPAERPEPDPSIYENGDVYPAVPVDQLTTHLKRGYAISTCLVCPLRWNPVDRSLEYLVEAEIIVETELGARERSGFQRFFRGDNKTHEWITEKIANDEVLPLYPRRDDGELETILVVTVDDLMEAAEEYAAWRNTRGQVTYIVTVDDLVEAEDGDDDQECIRNGIETAYQELDVGYVVLMGDTEQVPHRGLYCAVGDGADFDIPADLYYACLDGNWNRNGDQRWGEPNEADMLAEVIVGRLPGASNDEIRHITNKVMFYSDSPVVEDILTTLMLGEDLGWAVGGGAYMDEIYAGSNRNNHSTVGIPDRFRRRNLYDRDRVWSGPNDLRPLISQGYHFIHHLGHSFTNATMKININQANDNQITNNGEDNGFNIAYSQGCYNGAFDNRGTEPDQYFNFDCIAEKHISGMSNGFVAFICNSRYGWGAYYSTDGASQQYEREFVDAIFDEEINIIGETNQDSKEDIAHMAGAGVMRWCYYEINLLGDPVMDMWTDEPEEFNPDYREVIMMGEREFDVTVEGLEGATVCVSLDGEILGVGLTNENGDAHLEFPEPVSGEDPLTLAITAHNYLPFYTEIQPNRPDQGYPWVDDLAIDDADGNDNELADAGETIRINPLISNLGREILEGITLSFASDNPMIRIINSEAIYPDIEVEGDAYPEESIELSILSNCPDMRRIEVELLISNADGDEWIQNSSFYIHAPDLSGSRLVVLDEEGYDAGILMPGEERYMLLTSSNLGSSDVEELNAVLDCDNPFVEVVETETELDMLRINETNTFEQPFLVSVSDDCPDLHRAVFYVRISGMYGYLRTCMMEVGIGGAYYTFENEDEEWEHYNIGEDWSDQWHLNDRDNYTPDGMRCIKVGHHVNGVNHQDNLNCAMEMPEFHVSAPMQLFFQHKMDAEDSNDYPGRCYDGGFVEITVDNDNWETITPEGNGYPYRIRYGQSANPLDDNQAVYSGEFDWEPALFDLSDYEGEDVVVRFHYGADGSDPRKGWRIDDIQLRLLIEPEAPVDLTGEIRYGGAFLTWTTPPLRDDPAYPNELLGYRIFRSYDVEFGDFLDTLVTDHEYLDYLVGQPRGDYYYRVYSVYLTEELMSDEVHIFWTQDVNESEVGQPTEWALSSVYPNPFNSIARIVYSIPAYSSINLAVYDMRGRQVVLLADGHQLPGNHQVLMNADGLSSGLYVIRLKTPMGVKALRLVLVR